MGALSHFFISSAFGTFKEYMRHFFVGGVVVWLLGIGLGVYSGLVFTGIGACLFVVFAFMRRVSLPFVVAGVSLVVLGFVYGDAVRNSGATCRVSIPVIGTIRERRIESERTVYTVDDAAGCSLLVYAVRFPLYSVGDQVTLSGDVRALEVVRDENPGYAAYLERRGIAATILYPSFTRVAVGASPFFTLWHDVVREYLGRVLPEPDASVLLAMLFADKGTVPTWLYDQFRVTGMSHVLAISGLHVSLLLGMVLGIALLLPVSPGVRTLGVLMVLWGYVGFIGAPLSSVRAALFWTFALVAVRFGLLIPPSSVLLFAILVMVSLSPLVVTDVGFQLSVTAVAGIGLLLFFLRPYLGLHGLWGWIGGLAVVSLGASVGTFPLVAYHFGVISFVGVVVNLLVVPVVPGVLVFGLLALLLSFVIPPAALVAGAGVHVLLQWMVVVTRLAASLPGMWFEGIVWPGWAVGVYYAFVAVVAVVIVWLQRRSWLEVWE